MAKSILESNKEVMFNGVLASEIADKILQPLPLDLPNINIPTIRNYSLADYTYEVIMDRIKEFEDDLDDEHEVAVQLAAFGQSVVLSVTGITYSNPSTLVFHGYVGDQNATLIQHVNQLNFLLLAVKKADPEKPPRRIGFALPSED